MRILRVIAFAAGVPTKTSAVRLCDANADIPRAYRFWSTDAEDESHFGRDKSPPVRSSRWTHHLGTSVQTWQQLILMNVALRKINDALVAFVGDQHLVGHDRNSIQAVLLRNSGKLTTPQNPTLPPQELWEQ